MKRTLLVLTLPLLLAGCAQVFDGNLFQTIDKPAPLDASALGKATPDDIRNRMKDSTFTDQLKADPTALLATQTALATAIAASSATPAQVLADATTLVELTTSASSVTDMKAQATTNITSISDAISSGNYSLALKIFMGNQTPAQMTATLNNLGAMQFGLEAMSFAARKADDTLDSAAFFSSTTDKGSFAESALMAAIATALVCDSGSIATLVTNLSSASPTTPSGPHMTKFLAAKNGAPATFTQTMGTATSPNHFYAFVAIVIPELPLGL